MDRLRRSRERQFFPTIFPGFRPVLSRGGFRFRGADLSARIDFVDEVLFSMFCFFLAEFAFS
jgi:hypothetical protein